MGLDMYLYASRYISGWSHRVEPEYQKLIDITQLTPCKDSPSFSVEATVGYWRKANAIHSWFVKNVQEGRDECQRAYISREKLGELRATCHKVLDSVEMVEGKVNEGQTLYPDGRVEEHERDGNVVAQVGIASAILPTQEGFFFGKTSYDEDYLQDINDTIRIIDHVLNDPHMQDCEFYYRSSW